MDIPANIYCTKSCQLGSRVDYLKSHQPTNIIYKMIKESSQRDETGIIRYFLVKKLYSIIQVKLSYS